MTFILKINLLYNLIYIMTFIKGFLMLQKKDYQNIKF